MTDINNTQSDMVRQVFEKASKSAFGNSLITNNLRGLIAEAIISFALSPDWNWVSADYTGWDFERSDGLRLEVKQSAYLQTWNNIESLSKPIFDISSKTGYNDSASTLFITKAGRPAHIYIFAHHIETTSNADHRNPLQWEFYVVPTSALPDQKKISLNPLKSLCKPCGFDSLLEKVNNVAEDMQPIERT